MQYLIQRSGLPLVYVSIGDELNCILVAETDASHADCPDTARGRAGSVIYNSNAVVDAKTEMLKAVHPSTAASEQTALANCVLRVLAARNLMVDFGFPQFDPTFIGEDNMACLLNSKNPVCSRKARHLHIAHHLTRENQMEFKTINVQRVATGDMSADLQTKNLGTNLHNRHTARQMGHSCL